MAQLTGVVDTPGGTTPDGARVEITLYAGNMVAGLFNGTEILGTYQPDIAASGAWAASLTPNDLISPTGTQYKVNFWAEGALVASYWVVIPDDGLDHVLDDVLAGAPDPQDQPTFQYARGRIAYTKFTAAANAGLSTTSTTFVDFPDGTLVVPVKTRPVELRVEAGFLTASAVSVVAFGWFDVDAGVLIASRQIPIGAANELNAVTSIASVDPLPAAGDHDYKLQWKVSTGTASLFPNGFFGTPTAAFIEAVEL